MLEGPTVINRQETRLRELEDVLVCSKEEYTVRGLREEYISGDAFSFYRHFKKGKQMIDITVLKITI